MVTLAARQMVCWWMLALVVASVPVAPAPADEPLRELTSLGFVPADVAFYGTLLRNREQWDALMNSRAIARLKALPAMQIVSGLVQQQMLDPEGPWAKFEEWRSKEENAQLLDLLADAVSHEVFLYGNDEFARFTALTTQLQTAQQVSAVRDLVQKDGQAAEAGDSERRQRRAMLKVLDQHRDDLPIPAITIGFRITDKAAADAQIARLEELLKTELAKQDETDRLKRTKVAGSEFLVLSLDGTLLEKAGVDLSALEDEEGEFEALTKALEQQKLTIALGVRGDYLLLGIGETTDHLVPKKDADLLIDRDELAPVRKHADKLLTGMSWISPEYAKSVAAPGEQLANLLPMAESAIENADIEDEIKKELQADVRKLFDRLEEMLPAPAAVLTFTFWTDRGFEGYDYNWAKDDTLDPSQKLTLLDHVGGDPIGFFVARGKSEPGDYDAFVTFLKRVRYYVEEIGLDELTDEERAEYEKYRDALLPLAGRLDAATRDKLIPALKDGQGGLVFDAKLMSKQWSPAMPESAEPLPMVELALTFGVSDAKLLREAFREYYAIAQAAADTLHELDPEKVPEYTVPKPVATDVKNGTVYRYDVDEQVPLSEDLAPNAGLSESVAVLSFAPATTERLLAPTPLKATEGPLAASDQPLAAAGQFRFDRLIDALVPWVDYGFAMAAAQNPNAGGQLEPYRVQVVDFLDILKCYRGRSSVTTREGDVWIKHRESRWQDLPAEETP